VIIFLKKKLNSIVEATDCTGKKVYKNAQKPLLIGEGVFFLLL
jgi:hypothetical protein